MMAKKPTYNQKKFLKANRLDPFNWLVQKDTPEFMQIIHKYSGTVRKIKNEGGCMTLFELFSIVLMGVIALFGIGLILGFIVVGAIIINYFRWRHQEKKAARKRGQNGET